MRGIDRARLVRRLDHGIELDTGEGRRCWILLPSQGCARVVFIPRAGLREPRSWMVCGPADDTPWEGRDRLARGGALPLQLERLPLLVPAGAILPLTAEARNFSRLHDEPSRCVRIFPGRETGASFFTLYEDDGISLRYRDGEFACLDLQLDWDDEAVKLRVAKRGGYTLPYDAIAVAMPAGERRRLVLESRPGAPHLLAGSWQLHAHEHRERETPNPCRRPPSAGEPPGGRC